MRPKQVMTVVGTRPEAIKMAPVVHVLRQTAGIESIVCVTGQHKELLDPVLATFDIRPDYDLEAMVPGQQPGDLFQRLVDRGSTLIRRSAPDIVLVHGDTISAAALGMVAFYEMTPLAHVEAGLRTHNRRSPWPEEVNRRILSLVADLHFAPTAQASSNLLGEGVGADSIHITGNTIIDALRYIMPEYRANAGSGRSRSIVVTAHRRESLDGGQYAQILEGLGRVAAAFPEVDVLFVSHRNPLARASLAAFLGTDSHANISVVEPQDYRSFIRLLSEAYLVLTDSGGVQEEAPALGTPVLILRDETERPELVRSGGGVLVGTDPQAIFSNVSLLLKNPTLHRRMAGAGVSFGDGFAAPRIVAALVRQLGLAGHSENVTSKSFSAARTASK